MEGSPQTNQIPSEPFLKRYKFLWRVFLVSNFALGAYMFAQAGKREKGKEKEKEKEKRESAAKSVPAPAAVPVPVQEEPVFSPPVEIPVIKREPIPEDEQRKIFRWMLEEKRKVKPQNQDEKKRINEEKAFLKEIIRSESVPSI